MIVPICAVQGKQLLVFGGERIKALAEGAATQEHDDEDDLEPLADVCQLDWEANLWLNLPITGEQSADCHQTSRNFAASIGKAQRKMRYLLHHDGPSNEWCLPGGKGKWVWKAQADMALATQASPGSCCLTALGTAPPFCRTIACCCLAA